MQTYTFTNEERSDVRSMLRSQPGFEAFRVANGGFASRDFTLELILKAIEALGVAAEVDAIVARHAKRRAGMMDVPTDVEMAAEAEVDAAVRRDAAQEAMEIVTVVPSETALADTVLDQLRPFVSDKLLSTVSTALAPIVTAALKPAVEVERIVEIEVPAAGGAGRATFKRPAAARRASVSTFGKLFGAPRHAQAGARVQVWDSAEAEPVDPMYVVEPNQMALLVTAAERGGWVWLAGPAGGGKSTMPQQYAARTNSPFVTIAFNRATETTDLVGQFVLDGAGGMVWQDGVLTQAIRRPGTKILLDEIMFAPPGMAAIIQTLLSARVLTIHATGERVPVADGVVFVIADNTRGYGDETGLYVGTVQANAALVDRMARMIVVDYLEADLEAQALHNHTPGSTRAACDRVVAFVGGVRKLVGFENRPMSLRRMIAFVQAIQDGFKAEAAFETTMLSRLPEAERAALHTHIRANFDEGAFLAEMAGAPLPKAPSNAPQQTAARGAFDPVP